LATRQEVSLKKGGTIQLGQGPGRRFAQLDYFLIADQALAEKSNLGMHSRIS
jgi:hypothetical protein